MTQETPLRVHTAGGNGNWVLGLLLIVPAVSTITEPEFTMYPVQEGRCSGPHSFSSF